MIRAIASVLALVLCIECTTLYTNTSAVHFNEEFPSLEYFARDPMDGTVSKDAFVVDFNDLREVEVPSGVMVQQFFVGSFNYTFLVIDDSVEPNISGGLAYSKAYQIIYSAEAVGASIIFWLFTEDQTITDLGTNRTTTVDQGVLKFSMIIGLWPFVNGNNQLQLSANITTLHDTMTNCFIRDPEDPLLTSITCHTDSIQGSVQLLHTGSVFNHFTQQPSQIQTDIFVLACPTELYEDFPIVTDIPDTFCHIDISKTGEFPLNFESESYSSSDRFVIYLLSLRIHFSVVAGAKKKKAFQER